MNNKTRIPIPDLTRSIRLIGCYYEGGPVYRSYAPKEGGGFKVFYFIRQIEHVPCRKNIGGIKTDTRAEIVYYRIPLRETSGRKNFPVPIRHSIAPWLSGEPCKSKAGGKPFKDNMKQEQMLELIRDKKQLQVFVNLLIEERKHTPNVRWRKALELIQHGAELLWRLHDQSTLRTKG